MKLPRPARADLALVFVTIIWGCSFSIVKSALAQVSPLLFITLRFWVATVVTVVSMPRAIVRIPRQTWVQGSILAGYLLSGFLFQTLGLRATTPSKSAFITSLSVPLVPVLGFLLFGHRPRIQTLIGVALASIGLGFLTLESFEVSISVGDALTLLCAVAFALHILYIGRYVPSADYRQLVILQIGLSAVVSGALTPLLETPFLVWDARFAVYLAITGILATALGFYVQNRAQRLTTANRAALIFSLEPVFAVLFAYALLGHTLTFKETLGGILVLSGVLTSELRKD